MKTARHLFLLVLALLVGFASCGSTTDSVTCPQPHEPEATGDTLANAADETALSQNADDASQANNGDDDSEVADLVVQPDPVAELPAEERADEQPPDLQTDSAAEPPVTVDPADEQPVPSETTPADDAASDQTTDGAIDDAAEPEETIVDQAPADTDEYPDLTPFDDDLSIHPNSLWLVRVVSIQVPVLDERRFAVHYDYGVEALAEGHSIPGAQAFPQRRPDLRDLMLDEAARPELYLTANIGQRYTPSKTAVREGQIALDQPETYGSPYYTAQYEGWEGVIGSGPVTTRALTGPFGGLELTVNDEDFIYGDEIARCRRELDKDDLRAGVILVACHSSASGSAVPSRIMLRIERCFSPKEGGYYLQPSNCKLPE